MEIQSYIPDLSAQKIHNRKFELLKVTVIVIAVFTFIAFMSSIMMVFGRKPITWSDALLNSIIGWNSWAVTIPAALWLAWNYSIERNPLWKTLLIILGGSFAVIFFKACTLEFLRGALQVEHFDHKPYWARVSGFIFDPRLLFECIIFWFILATVYAFFYYQNLKERENRSSHLEYELAQARLHSLQMQLQPHFLFNTLNSISSLLREPDEAAAVKNVSAADRMITSLSDMFRHTLKTSNIQMTPLREELEFLKNYISIEKIRFSDRLTVEMEIDQDLESKLVPSFFLQPLVENAVRHGIAKLSNNGIIRIHIYKKENQIIFLIQDNGTCTDDDLKDGLDQGLGLSNTRKRLQYLYGDGCEFTIRKNDRQETEICVKIPDCQHNTK